MLIWLTHANHLYSDRKQVRKMQPYPPLQTLLVAALLRQHGHQVSFFDCTFDRDFAPHLDRAHPDLIAVVEDNFNFLTKMCLLQNRELAFEIARAARARGIVCVVNSSDATGKPKAYLDAGFDRVILGEPEATLVELIRQWPANVSGTASQHPGFAGYESSSTAVPNLDNLPLPAWDLLDFAVYRRAWMDAHGYFSLNLAASRGCPYRCNWCAKPIHGDTYRSHTPRRVVREMQALQMFAAPDHIWFADDIFGLPGGFSGRWVKEFAGCLQQHGLRIPFRMQSRCDLMTSETVTALAQAGCEEIWMGAESGSQRILDRMEKGLRVQQIGEARENLRRNGIRCGLFLQFGYLGEEWDDIEQTIRMVRGVQPDDIGVSVSYPLPNTRFYQIVNPQAETNANWRDSDDLAVMTPAAFPPEFYRALADALHAEVRYEPRGGKPSESIQKAWDKVEQLRCACC